jgi:predicted helicase
LNFDNNGYESLTEVASKEVKAGQKKDAIFKLFSTGINSGRDEWITDFDKKNLTNKIEYYSNNFNLHSALSDDYGTEIKWSRNIKEKSRGGKKEKFSDTKIKTISYRPFTKLFLYNSNLFIDERGNSNEVHGPKLEYDNIGIVFTGPNSQKPFLSHAVSIVSDYHFVGAASSTQCLPLYRYDTNGNRLDNITDWGLQQFREHYQDDSITKEAIFHYTYALLHHPAYRTKYGLNLKRDFPRLPFYGDFNQWVSWGKSLMDLHINYETVSPFPLERKDTRPTVKPQQPALFDLPAAKRQLATTATLLDVKAPKPRLKADHLTGQIEIDDITTLTGIPPEAWEYKLGNRSALEWVLDQYKEKKPKDPTIAAKFNTYHFADYKEHVIDLLQRVCTVSVETMRIIDQMPKE